jgi:tetratricopeptide (TPR) repeat protein
MGLFQPAVHRTFVIIDVENFGDPARTNTHQLAVREGMYEALQRSFAQAGISWASCVAEDRGDGILVLVPPEVPKSWLASRVPVRLAAILAMHNAACQVQERIRLRMALHAGEVHRDARGWAGVSLNRAFRLIDTSACRLALRESSGVLAVIISDWFYDEVVRHDPAAVPACFRRAQVAVKETKMAAWVRIVQDGEALSGEETGQVTPAPMAPEGQLQLLPPAPLPVRFSLPPDTAAFTGREEELDCITAGVTAAAAGGQVVAIHTIDGMPGIGKTTLAVHAAHLLKGQFPDRQLFLDLQAHTPGQEPLPPEAALAGLLIAIGVEGHCLPADLPGRTALWRDRLAGQRALLVLDNAADSDQVAPLLPGSEGCLVLVTSRRHLGDLPAAVVPVPLEILAPEKAREMFVRLAPRAIADPPEAVAELVQLAGFLPLAISLLARVYTRQQSWSMADLTVETRASLLTLAAERNTVAAAFDVSYRHLNRRQQRFFRYLGLHPGTTVDPYAAAALAGVPLQEACGHLDALCGESLLIQVGYLRYGMHDLIRRYARDRASAGPAAGREQAVERLLDYYQYAAALAEALLARCTHATALPASLPAAAPVLTGHDHALEWARTERANLLACLDHATGTGQHARVIALTTNIAALLRLEGPWADALTRHAAALRAARCLSDKRGQARILSELAPVQRFTGDWQDADKTLNEALDLFGGLGDRRGQANVLLELGNIRWLTDDCPGAVQLLEEALSIFRDLDDWLGQAQSLMYLGGARYRIGAYPDAAQALEEALNIHRDRGDRRGQADVLYKLGTVRRLTGDYPDAARSLEKALDIFREVGSQHGKADILCELGTLRRVTADYPGAASFLEEALSIHRDTGDRFGQAEVLNEAGTLHILCGRPHRARECHQQALSIARQIGTSWMEAKAIAGLGRCALATGDTHKAENSLRQSLEIFQRIGAAEAIEISAELETLAESHPGVQKP